MNARVAALITFLLLPPALAKTENGPNGGELRDLKIFWVEAKPLGKNKVMVYLLDKKKKNATVKKSDVLAAHMHLHDEFKMSCRPKKNKYFECLSKTELKEGSLFLWVTREDVKFDSVVVFNFPIKSN